MAFEDRWGGFIFVAIPGTRGRYLRTDKSVALVPCPMCRAQIGEPCTSTQGDGYGGTTHANRRAKAQHLHRGADCDDVIAIELAPDGTAVEL